MNRAVKTTAFPVVLFDGECEIPIGTINIHKDFLFHQFQAKLSQLIGIHSDDLTTYLVLHNFPQSPMFLIHHNVNFAVLVTETNSKFVVVLNCHRTQCRLIPGRQSNLLRSRWTDYDVVRVHNFRMQLQRENYFNFVLNSGYRSGFGVDPRLNVNFPVIQEAYPRVVRGMCEDCTEAQRMGMRAEFHLCVYDQVVHELFRPPAGPISRRR